VDVCCGHAGLQGLSNRAINEQCGTACQTQALDLVRVFNHAATCGDGRGADKGEMRVGGANAFREHELHVLVEAYRTGRESAVGETLAENREWAFVFLPGQHVCVLPERAGIEQLLCAAFFKGGADKKRLRFGRHDQSPEALTAVETEVRKIVGRRGRIGQHNRIDFGFDHEPLGTLDAGEALCVGEGMGKRRQNGKSGDGLRQGGDLQGRCGLGAADCGCRSDRGGCAKKLAPGKSVA
jgi:hypothetical protein